jgi:hypothetical protein
VPAHEAESGDGGGDAQAARDDLRRPPQ